MKKRDDQTTYLFVAGVVAIVAVVALVLSGSGNLNGAAYYGKYDNPGGFQNLCTDDDPENDFYLAGTVSLGPYVYEDYCQDGMLTQYFCENDDNVDATRYYECPNGCWKGKCLEG